MKTLEEVKNDHILHVLRYCDYRQNKAAQILGISVRGLRNIIDSNPEHFKEVPRYNKGKEEPDWKEIMARCSGVTKELLYGESKSGVERMLEERRKP